MSPPTTISEPAPKNKEKAPRATSFDPQVARAFGCVARSMRVERGIAQDAFALAAGVDRSYYGKLERGERQPSLSILLRISTALGSPGALVLAAVEQQLNPTKARPRRPRTA